LLPGASLLTLRTKKSILNNEIQKKQERIKEEEKLNAIEHGSTQMQRIYTDISNYIFI